MKTKIFFLVLLIFSCTSGSDSDQDNNNGGNNNSENNLLVSEIISYSGNDSSDQNTQSFFYDDGDGLDGNKLTSTRYSNTYDGGEPQETSYSSYIYTNGKITRVLTYSSWNDELSGEIEFDYDNNGRLIYAEGCDYFSNGECQEFSNSEYSYSNNNQTITEEVYSHDEYGSYNSTIIWQLDNQGNISSANGTWEETYDGETSSGSGSYSMQYDNKNSPFKNIAGLNAMILRHLDWGYGDLYTMQFSTFNNIISATSSSDEDEIYVNTLSYDYNDFDYPRQVESTYYDGYLQNGIINYYQ